MNASPYDHPAIRELIIQMLFVTTPGNPCLADFDIDSVNPIPLVTIALATTIVCYFKILIVIF